MSETTDSDAHLQQWVGREEQHTDLVSPAAVRALAATLDLPEPPGPKDPLPAGWHWLFFNPAARRSELGDDGHPARGGFLPPVALPRRMWAGSRIRYLAPLPIGANATRTSRIVSVTNKSGKRGSLCFVTVEHTTCAGSTTCIVEEQDIVYREATPPGAKPPAPKPHDGQPQWQRTVSPDTTLLFRYSALTFNGHRIHYDEAYARDVEGYHNLVVHGPLTATLLQGFAMEHGGGRALTGFDFRGVSPLFVDRPFTLEARTESADSLQLWARGPDQELAMSATANFASGTGTEDHAS